jgi:hypothetical protein
MRMRLESTSAPKRSDKRRYPVAEFKAFVQSARRYIAITAVDPIHSESQFTDDSQERSAGSEWSAGVPGLERKRIPGDILFEADRLECQLFAGYDPSFDGNEPPGL